MVTNKIVSWGGGIIVLLLPALVLAGGTKGLSLSYSVSDNLYLLSTKEPGSFLTVSPFLLFSHHFDVAYHANLYIINFATENAFLENSLSLQKHLYLSGVGNKNSIYVHLYSLFAPSLEIYQYTSLSAGDSMNYYLFGSLLCAPGIALKYRHFVAESLPDYLEPGFHSSLSIPLPYFFLVPGGAVGAKVYEERTLPFYRIYTRFDFPLSMDLSVDAAVDYQNYAVSDEFPPITLSLIDEPFLEEETIEDRASASLTLQKRFPREKMVADAHLIVFKKNFFPLEDLTRADSGISMSLQLTKTLDPRSTLSLSLESLINSSSVDDFDYTRNSFGIRINLIF